MTAQVDTHTDGTPAPATEETAPAPRKLVTREAVLAADDRKYEIVEVPEWGGAVRIASMTAANRLAFEEAKSKAEKSGVDDPGAIAIAFSCVDENGALLFMAEDIPNLQAKSVHVVLRILERVTAINTLDKKSAEELRKN